MGRGAQTKTNYPTATKQRKKRKPSGRSQGKNKRTYKPSAEQLKRREDAQAYISRLDDEITALTPEQYQGWLASLPRLYTYSLNNYKLISHFASLEGFVPSRVATMKRWWKEGRKIKKGAQALPIRIPKTKKEPTTDSLGNPVLDAEGNEKLRSCRYFLLKFPVFDISQTELVDAEKVPTERNKSARQAFSDLSRVCDELGIELHAEAGNRGSSNERMVNTHFLTSSSNGFFADQLNLIALRAGLSQEEKARVLAHELAHAVMHKQSKIAEAEAQGEKITRQQVEVEAEATSYAICCAYEIESDYSAGYITNWGKDAGQLRRSSKRIQEAAKEIFSIIDGDAHGAKPDNSSSDKAADEAPAA